MKTDIKDREDIVLLVNNFYDKVKIDETIGYFFNDVAKVDWAHHLPKMYDFWENILFHTGNFKGNPMIVHKELSEKMPLYASHFDHWLLLFYETIHSLYEGENVAILKQRALSIATVMKIKIACDYQIEE